MALNITGTAGNDTLAPTGLSDPGVHTIDGLNGDDSISAIVPPISAPQSVNISGSGGFDTIYVEGLNGTIRGGDGNDSIIWIPVPGDSIVMFGNFGSDTIRAAGSRPVTIVGGDGSSDGHDDLTGSFASDLVFGNGGNDTISGFNGNDTMIGGQGNDSIFAAGSGNDLVFANEGHDTINVFPGGDLVFAGQGNDSVIVRAGSGAYFLNEGGDSFDGIGNTSALTVQGGNDSADGGDSIITGGGADVILGNGGLDIINAGDGRNVLVGGFGHDTIFGGRDADFIFGNQDNDTIHMGNGEGADTVFGGHGDDIIYTASGAANALINGNEGNDTIQGNLGADTISGGAGTDRFNYFSGADDGNGAAGGPIELITDVNFAEDRFYMGVDIELAANASAGNAGSLAQAADNALRAVHQQNGNASEGVAAVFAFLGRTYLAADTSGFDGQFVDSGDLLIDITGAVDVVTRDNFAHS
jgi:Ca2+-binding RTX toxin-like protein